MAASRYKQSIRPDDDVRHLSTQSKAEPENSAVRSALKSAILTVLTLFGGLLIGLLAGDIAFHLIPGSSVNDVKLGHAAIAAIPALIGFLVGGATWGILMGRLAGTSNTRGMATAGLLGFGPITIILALFLGIAELALVELVGQPIHRVFTLLFVPSAFLIAGVSAWAIGLGLRDRKLARSIFWGVGLTAAFTFLIVNLTMESLGWVVGAPGAVERATMVTVLALGNIAAALTGGAFLGWMLAESSDQLSKNGRIGKEMSSIDKEKTSVNINIWLVIGGIAGSVLFIPIAFTIGEMRDGYNHIAQGISALSETGAPAAWAQTGNFIIVGLLLIGLSVSLHRGISQGTGSVLGPALIASFGLLVTTLNGVFPADPVGAPETTVGTAHSLFAGIGFIYGIVSMFILPKRLQKDKDWENLSIPSRWFGIASTILIVIYLMAQEGAIQAWHPYTGLFQRGMGAAVMLWLFLLAIRLLHTSRKTGQWWKVLNKGRNYEYY